MQNKIKSPDGSPLAFDSPVLKAGEVGELVDGRAALQRAREQAKRLLAEARKIRDEAYEKGYQEGLRAGNAKSASQMIGLVAASVDYLAAREREVAAVVVASVDRVFGKLGQDELILHSVRRSLSELRNQQSVTVRAAPANANTLLEGLPHEHPEVGVLTVIADDRLTDDECVIETDIGIVNINRTDFLDALKSRICKRLGIPAEQLDREMDRLAALHENRGAATQAEAAPDAGCFDPSRLTLEPLR